MKTDSRASPRPQIVVMGVSGSGKSTVGARLAEVLGVRFVDGDSLHSAENVAKMSAGHALTDDDRWPWLAAVGHVLHQAGQQGDGVVVACSALKRSYRDAILVEAPGAVFIELTATRDVLERRVIGRTDHFMPVTLLDSQLATLETLESDEPGDIIDVDRGVESVVTAAADAISARLESASR